LSPLRDRELEEFLARLFEAAVVGRRRRRRGDGEEEGAGAGAAPPPPPIELSRHDLFHAHLFASSFSSSDSPPSAASLGLLFHAAEYPKQTKAQEEEEQQGEGGRRPRQEANPPPPDASSSFPFPYDLGKCQRDSELEATRDVLDWRSLLYFGGELASFSVARGGPLRPLLRPGTAPLRTVYEEDLALAAGGAGGGGKGGWVGPDVLCFHARDVVGEGRGFLGGFGGGGGGWGGGRGRGGGLRLRPPPEPVETSLGPLHVFLSY
jgi:hypothetical protein